MLGIGEFAGLTGLSVKALRHYDEKGVLVPADVDERSGYRRYADAQVRTGVVVGALRGAGVPLPAVSSAVASGDAAAALRRHRRSVLEEREREDRAFAAAETVLAALAVPVEVRERAMPPQPYAGRSLIVPVEDADELTDEDANEVFASVHAQVRAAGLGPTGPFWTALRTGEGGSVELACCWPTSAEADASVHGPDGYSGTLPARTELVAIWRPTDDEQLPEGSLHPAIVALFDAAGDRGVRWGDSEIRQTVLGQGPEGVAVEVSLTISG